MRRFLESSCIEEVSSWKGAEEKYIWPGVDELQIRLEAQNWKFSLSFRDNLEIMTTTDALIVKADGRFRSNIASVLWRARHTNCKSWPVQTPVSPGKSQKDLEAHRVVQMSVTSVEC